MSKVVWTGEITGVQPRIDLLRSFDERQHSYPGYWLRTAGIIDGAQRGFAVRVGPAAQVRHALRAVMHVSGFACEVLAPDDEVADLYKVTGLKVESAASGEAPLPPRGIQWEEEAWVDGEATTHRGPDE